VVWGYRRHHRDGAANRLTEIYRSSSAPLDHSLCTCAEPRPFWYALSRVWPSAVAANRRHADFYTSAIASCSDRRRGQVVSIGEDGTVYGLRSKPTLACC